MIHEEDRPRAIQAAYSRSQGERTDIEYRVVRPDGSVRWIRDRAFPMTDQSGNTYRVTGIAEDITDRKKAQSVLATQYEIARILAEAQELSEATPQLLQKICVDLGWDIGAIWAVDRNGSAIYCSGAWSPIQDRLCDFETATRFAELPPGLGLPGRVWATRTAYWVTDLSDDAEFPLGWAARSGGLQTGVGIPISLAGRVHGVIEFFSSDRRERDEEVVKLITLMANQIAQFIERRQGEKELRQSEERFRLIAETVTEVFWMADQEADKAFYVSPAYEKVWGRTIESFRNSPRAFLDAVLEEDRQSVETVLRLQTAGMPFGHEYRIVRPDGSIRWIWDRGFPVKTVDGRVTRYVGVAQDITDRRQAEKEMREGEERFRNSFDYAPIGMALAATDGRWLRVNKSLCEITGYSKEELLGRDYQSITHPEDLDIDLDQGRKLLDDEERFYQIEKRYVHKEGHTVWVILSVSLLRDSAGKPLYFVKEIQDISARKRMEDELTTTRDAALESARLKTEFLANMSHEIRTPMNGIIGMAELLFDTDLSPEQRDLVDTIQSSGDSLLTIINDILDFSKIEAGKVTFDICDFSLKKTVESTVEFFADLAFRKDIELASFVHPDIAPTLRGDPLRLRQVLINLLGNALKFT
ncbi:MAG: PAS domain S-box protein, partial [Blastocatellia bacterium]